MIKILVIDDHPIVRRGINQSIQDINDIIIAGEASNGEEALERIGMENYDLAILDISMPGKNGIDVIKEIKAVKQALPILVLSMHAEKEIVLSSLKAGAAGYLTKDSAPNELIEAIYKLYDGKKFLSSDIINVVIQDPGKDYEELPHEALSSREFQLMVMIASGKTIKEIAYELALSTKTISTHRYNILKKMNLRSNAELIRYAVKHNLIDW